MIDGAPVSDGSSEEALETLRLVYRIYCADAEWKARWDLSDGAEALE